VLLKYQKLILLEYNHLQNLLILIFSINLKQFVVVDQFTYQIIKHVILPNF